MISFLEFPCKWKSTWFASIIWCSSKENGRNFSLDLLVIPTRKVSKTKNALALLRLTCVCQVDHDPFTRSFALTTNSSFRCERHIPNPWTIASRLNASWGHRSFHSCEKSVECLDCSFYLVEGRGRGLRRKDGQESPTHPNALLEPTLLFTKYLAALIYHHSCAQWNSKRLSFDGESLHCPYITRRRCKTLLERKMHTRSRQSLIRSIGFWEGRGARHTAKRSLNQLLW